MMTVTHERSLRKSNETIINICLFKFERMDLVGYVQKKPYKSPTITSSKTHIIVNKVQSML